MEKTDSIYLAAFSAILPLTLFFYHNITEPWYYRSKIMYYSCPNCAR